MTVSHQWHKFIPEELEEGVLYISKEYSTAIHLCCCGCKRKVVTPLSPAGWELTENADTVSLSPSIGNWSFPCQSHYWIINGTVKWSYAFTKEEILSNRQRDNELLEGYIQENSSDKITWWKRLLRFLGIWKRR